MLQSSEMAKSRSYGLPRKGCSAAFAGTKLMRIGERYSIFRQPLLDIRPRCADELTSRESLVVGHLPENKVRDDQGIGFRSRAELCFGQSQALKCAFKNVDA